MYKHSNCSAIFFALIYLQKHKFVFEKTCFQRFYKVFERKLWWTLELWCLISTLCLVIVLWRRKRWVLSNDLFQRKQGHGSWKEPEVKDNLSVITRNKYHLSKQVMPMKYALEKRFFAAAILLKLCELLLFGERKKNRVYLGLYKFSLDFQRREDQINFVHER